VQFRGADVVYKAGLRVLEYPPTWIDTIDEVVKVVKEISKAGQ